MWQQLVKVILLLNFCACTKKHCLKKTVFNLSSGILESVLYVKALSGTMTLKCSMSRAGSDRFSPLPCGFFVALHANKHRQTVVCHFYQYDITVLYKLYKCTNFARIFHLIVRQYAFD